jgi:hypothetical protein
LKRAGRRKPARQRAQETCATKGAGNLRDKRAGLLEKSRKTAQQKSRKSAQQKGRFARKEQVCSRAVSLIQFVRKRAGNLLDKRAGNLPDKRAGNLLDTPGGLTIRKRAGLLESSVSHSVCPEKSRKSASRHPWWSHNPEKSRFAREQCLSFSLSGKEQEICLTKEQKSARQKSRKSARHPWWSHNPEKSRFAREQCLSFSLSSR